MKTNKELKSEYKQMKFRMGVFQIRNIINGKIFIDSSPNMDSKWNRHKTELKFGNHRNSELQIDRKKFGEKNFVFEVLSNLEQKEGENINFKKELLLLEEMLIDELKPFGENGYNIAKRKK
ncbi:MAG: GIY-YIG nuclease family protein [Melioribacteraceae bacterium]|nr:GIY-YIG nuclease family protein [Melioribacteraceae bacterium]